MSSQRSRRPRRQAASQRSSYGDDGADSDNDSLQDDEVSSDSSDAAPRGARGRRPRPAGASSSSAAAAPSRKRRRVDRSQPRGGPDSAGIAADDMADMVKNVCRHLLFKNVRSAVTTTTELARVFFSKVPAFRAVRTRERCLELAREWFDVALGYSLVELQKSPGDEGATFSKKSYYLELGPIFSEGGAPAPEAADAPGEVARGVPGAAVQRSTRSSGRVRAQARSDENGEAPVGAAAATAAAAAPEGDGGAAAAAAAAGGGDDGAGSSPSTGGVDLVAHNILGANAAGLAQTVVLLVAHSPQKTIRRDFLLSLVDKLLLGQSIMNDAGDVKEFVCKTMVDEMRLLKRKVVKQKLDAGSEAVETSLFVLGPRALQMFPKASERYVRLMGMAARPEVLTTVRRMKRDEKVQASEQAADRG